MQYCVCKPYELKLKVGTSLTPCLNDLEVQCGTKTKLQKNNVITDNWPLMAYTTFLQLQGGWVSGCCGPYCHLASVVSCTAQFFSNVFILFINQQVQCWLLFHFLRIKSLQWTQPWHCSGSRSRCLLQSLHPETCTYALCKYATWIWSQWHLSHSYYILITSPKLTVMQAKPAIKKSNKLTVATYKGFSCRRSPTVKETTDYCHPLTQSNSYKH